MDKNNGIGSSTPPYTGSSDSGSEAPESPESTVKRVTSDAPSAVKQVPLSKRRFKGTGGLKLQTVKAAVTPSGTDDTSRLKNYGQKLFDNTAARNSQVSRGVIAKPERMRSGGMSLYPVTDSRVVLWAHPMPGKMDLDDINLAIKHDQGMETFPESVNQEKEPEAGESSRDVQEKKESSERADFWLLIEKNNIDTIISLSDAGLADYKDFEGVAADGVNKIKAVKKNPVKLAGFEESASQNRVEVSFEAEEGQTRSIPITVINYHFWADQEGVSAATIDKMLALMPSTNCAVHCLGGKGRTGTLITLKMMQEASKTGELPKENLVSKIQQMVVDGRAMRMHGEYVQTAEQMQTLLNYGMHITGASLDDIETQLKKVSAE